ncbi:hypothetical protein O181_069622 [Austropuccinia psidii MF-1]|uniref:FIST domain-containing protein n=1 Tax=Austropuccinia psidii MF-1 TaxID=1389203 RepID=A0A9Q3F4I6_9BASI|nr:hypothetical protein [Austropuccinia psidii MF-1]
MPANVHRAGRLRRSYWSATTFRSSAPPKLVDAVEEALRKRPASARSPLLFTISKRLPPDLLSRLVDSFQSVNSDYEPIGCLVEDRSSTCFSVSILRWLGASASFVAFTSNLPSRPTATVGREIWPSLIPFDALDSIKGQDPELSFSTAIGLKSGDDGIGIKVAMQNLPQELKSLSPNSVQSLIFFSAPSPEPLLDTLGTVFPTSGMMGLIGSSTTFETGRRSTLFRGKWIGGEQGAVGIAILDKPTLPAVHPSITYRAMQAFGEPMKITKAKGNIILTLNHQKATQCLLKAIAQSSELTKDVKSPILLNSQSNIHISKEKDFYLGFMDEKSRKTVDICKITAGSLSRGAMAIGQNQRIKTDQFVQFLHSIDSQKNSEEFHSLDFPLIEFECHEPFLTEQEKSKNPSLDEEILVIENLFSCGSEYGFIPRHRQIVTINSAKATLPLA